MKFTVKGTIKPPRGTPGANGVYAVDLELECPQRLARLVALAGLAMAQNSSIAREVRDYWNLLLQKVMVERLER